MGPNTDIDVGVRRSPEELAAWKRRDPVRRLVDALVNDRGVEKSRFEQIDSEIETAIAGAVEFARNSAYPDANVLMDYVYAGDAS